MGYHENYRCVAPGKSEQFLEYQYMKVPKPMKIVLCRRDHQLYLEW